ncbi:MAG TPA: DUF4255 domain-containing protein [Kofleriaceae bacterium]|nr:DUF4255 domain-containing protein [Kofleriaceae bacterium]
MSNTLAIGAVTTTLRNMLLRARSPIDGVDPPKDPKLNDVEVTIKPLDRARNAVTKTQLNLFLYDIRPNPAMRNLDPPRLRPNESAMPPLALDLYYLLSAWGEGDADDLAHRALGWAMAQLNDQAILLPSTIQAAIAEADLNRQVERVRLTPISLSLEDMSKVWTMAQATYRPSIAYLASVVLIDSARRSSAPLPVLAPTMTTAADLDPPVPTLTGWSLPSGAPSAQLGETITVTGFHLDGAAVTACFTTPLSATPLTVVASAGATATRASFVLPSDPAALAGWPAGACWLTVGPDGAAGVVTNQVGFQLAPVITDVQPDPATVDGNGDVTLTVTFAASVWPEQQVALIVGDRLVRAPARATKVTQLAFVVRKAPKGTQFVRVRVDGVDSRLVTYPTLAFDTSQQVTIQ